MTEVLWDQPLKQAEFLDHEYSKNKNGFFDRYPFAGFVFSIKDSNKLKDTDCTNGFIVNVGVPY